MCIHNVLVHVHVLAYLFAAGRRQDKHQQADQRHEHARQHDVYHVVHRFSLHLQKQTNKLHITTTI